MRMLLPLALLLAARAAAAGPEALPLAGTRLDLSATGTVTRAPDVATIGVGVVTQARTAREALAANAGRMTATIAALKRSGVAARDIQTDALTLAPQYRYVNDQPPVLTGYQATNRVSARLRDVAAAGAVLDALAAAGANQIDGPSFSLDHPEAALDEARTQALATARARAELYARAAGLHVRRIVGIGESDAAPTIRPLAGMAMRKAPETPIESGEQALSVTLSVTFELE